MEIDIRKEGIPEISVIKFADYDPNGELNHNADQVRVENGNVFIEVGKDYDNSFVFIRTKQDAENLIKALQKAIELNWWQDSQ